MDQGPAPVRAVRSCGTRHKAKCLLNRAQFTADADVVLTCLSLKLPHLIHRIE